MKTGGARRAAVFIDLENAVYPERQAKDWRAATTLVEQCLEAVRRMAMPVLMVAVCDADLAKTLAIPLATLGIRTYAHGGGLNAADDALVVRLAHDVPESCEVVVIVSGDHAFVETALSLRKSGKEVQVMGRQTQISAKLYRAASAYTDIAASPTKLAA